MKKWNVQYVSINSQLLLGQTKGKDDCIYGHSISLSVERTIHLSWQVPSNVYLIDDISASELIHTNSYLDFTLPTTLPCKQAIPVRLSNLEFIL